MGGIEFDYKGKVYSVCLEGGCIPFGDPADLKAFSKWLKTPEGQKYFGRDFGYEYDGSDDDDYSDEEEEAEEEDSDDNVEYLSDAHPFDPDTEDRKDAEVGDEEKKKNSGDEEEEEE